jgi:chaperone required for assembly of F1-ATPase
MRRFWREVTVAADGQGHIIRLDARPLRTPKQRPLVVPSETLARAIAAEWAAQGETAEPRSMRLTRLATTRIDLFPEREADARAEIAGYLGSDLLAHRADAPPELVEREARAWDPWLAWAATALDLAIEPVTGVIARDPDPAAVAVLERHLARLDPWRLVAAHAGTVLTGSCVLGLALEQGVLAPEDAFALAQLDELFEIERWGLTDLARERHARLRADLEAAAGFAAALRG